jgi:hypothetical protein
MNLQVISSPHGEILWVSGPLPGAAYDLTAARIWGIIRQLAAAGLIVLADKGYTGAGEHVLTPYRGRNKPASQKAANSAHAKLRAPGERANAQLKTWGILRKLRCCPRARRPNRQSHPRPPSPRDRRMKNVHCVDTRARIRRVHVRAASVEVLLGGSSLARTFLELNGAESRAAVPSRRPAS